MCYSTGRESATWTLAQRRKKRATLRQPRFLFRLAGPWAEGASLVLRDWLSLSLCCAVDRGAEKVHSPLLLKFFFFWVWDRAVLYRPSWPWTCDPPASVTWLPGLQVHANMPRLLLCYLKKKKKKIKIKIKSLPFHYSQSGKEPLHMMTAGKLHFGGIMKWQSTGAFTQPGGWTEEQILTVIRVTKVTSSRRGSGGMGEGVQTHSTVPCHYNMKKASSNRSVACYRPHTGGSGGHSLKRT